jgi:hypothetical protein
MSTLQETIETAFADRANLDLSNPKAELADAIEYRRAGFRHVARS